MVNPVPGHSVTTEYKKTGSNWTTCGFHTGQDYAAPAGTNVVAARSGTVAHVNYGSSLGEHQFAIRPGDGTEDFYAHTSTRPSNGAKVSAGAYVAEVGSEGNATGPHLHFERHANYGWSCGSMQDPMLSHNAGGGSSPTPPPASGSYPKPTSKKVYLSKLHYGQEASDSVWYLQDVLNKHSLAAPGNVTLPLTGNYFDQTGTVVVACQNQHGFGNDPVNKSYVGSQQASHLFVGSGLTVVDD
jgi:murein DD-endopeptidase MepM/ murein hydrolase activator NlpD